MRIALVAEDYYPQLGGVPEHVHNLALQLNAWGHTAAVVTSHMGDYPDAAFVVVGAVVEENARYLHADCALTPRGGDTSFFHPNGRRPTDALTDRPRLLFLVRIEPRTGLGTLLDPMPHILARYPRALLTVAGDGPWRGYYERRGRELGASVRFVGKVFEDRPDHYGSADLYLCPTHIASFGVTLLEAMACGTPMVVADNHGYRSVVDGGAEALIVSKDDPKIWAESAIARSEEHTSELQSQSNLVCRLLLEKKKSRVSLDRAVHLPVAGAVGVAV